MCQLFTQLHNLSSLFHRHILSLLLQFWLISLTRKVMDGIWIYMNAMRSLSTWKAYLKWTTSHIWPPLIKCLTCPRKERMHLTRSKFGHLYFLYTSVWTLNVFCRYHFWHRSRSKCGLELSCWCNVYTLLCIILCMFLKRKICCQETRPTFVMIG